MLENLRKSLMDAAKSVIPVALIVLGLQFSIAPMPSGMLAAFLIGAILVITGIGIFSAGAEYAMMPMGRIFSSLAAGRKKFWPLILTCLVCGFALTAAEPDLRVLAGQVPSVPESVMVAAVALGEGVFLVAAVIRLLFKISIRYVFIISYALVFIFAAVAAPDYLALAFDSGGVTTGAVTVPFLLAFAGGVSAARGRNTQEDSFGMCAICAAGPIIAVLVTEMFYAPSAAYPVETVACGTFAEVLSLIGSNIAGSAIKVLAALVPVSAVFLIYQLILFRLPKNETKGILSGLVYTFAGLVLFFTGVNAGFMPAGIYFGNALGSLSYNWILVPVVMAVGYFIVAAEPTVQVLKSRIERVTGCAVSKKMMAAVLSGGVSIGLAVAILRILAGISIWYILVPGYALALLLSFFVPEIFTSVAFDMGVAASCSMAPAFLLPLAAGVCKALGGSVMADAFGIIGIIAMMPVIAMQFTGLIYNIRLKKSRK